MLWAVAQIVAANLFKTLAATCLIDFFLNYLVWGGFGRDTNEIFGRPFVKWDLIETCILVCTKCLAGRFSSYKVKDVYFTFKSQLEPCIP